MIKEESVKIAVAKIFEEFEKSTLLGAAIDCMSEKGKASLEKKLEQIVQEIS